MTRVCVIGEPENDLRKELFDREGSRRALEPYALSEPWANTVAIDTVSLGAAMSLLNDLDWYLVRFSRDAIILEPSVSETEWLSRELGRAIRDQEIYPAETTPLVKIYGVIEGELVDPMYAQRVNDRPLEYDLRSVDDTVVVRITEAEFGN